MTLNQFDVHDPTSAASTVAGNALALRLRRHKPERACQFSEQHKATVFHQDQLLKGFKVRKQRVEVTKT